MSAFGTKKKDGDEAVQLTFPAVYSRQYARDRTPLEFVRKASVPSVTPYAGTDFQANYHQQKMADAHRMAKAKVTSTQNMKTRAFSSHQGYFGMPAPVLAQRKYANPSYGMDIVSSARRDGSVPAPFTLKEEGLSGGVLRSAEGQAYGKARLMSRISQLNAIESAKQSFKGLAPPQEADAEYPSLEKFTELAPIGDVEGIELQSLLKGILNTTVVGDYDKLTSATFFGDGTRMLKLLLRWAIGATEDDYEDKIAVVENILQNIIDLSDPDRVAVVVGEADDSGERYGKALVAMGDLYGKVLRYLREMLAFINSETRSVAQKKAKSRALVKELGFASGFHSAYVEEGVRGREFRDMSEDFDDGPDDGHFDAPATSREDSEAQSRYVDDFSHDERQSFGYQSGSFYRSTGSFFGEAPAEAGEMVDPYTRSRPTSEAQYEPLMPQRAVTASEAPSVRRTVSEETGGPDVVVEAPKVRRKLRQPAEMTFTRDDIPKTREELDALAKRINAAGGIREDGTVGEGGKAIRVYSAGTVANTRKNFFRRLRI